MLREMLVTESKKGDGSDCAPVYQSGGEMHHQGIGRPKVTIAISST